MNNSRHLRNWLPLLFFILYPSLIWAQSKQDESHISAFKVKNYHVRAQKSIWDSKTAVLTAERNVDISLYLIDQTTAHILSDWAQEDRARGKGVAKGNVRSSWGDLKVLSSEIRWDFAEQKIQFAGEKAGGVSPTAGSRGDSADRPFSGKGKPAHLTMSSFTQGRLEMDCETLENTIDSKHRSYLTAAKARGVWTPK